MSISTAVPSEPSPPSVPASNGRRGEIWRKSLHLLPGALPFVLAMIPHPRPLDVTSQLVVGALCVFLTLVFLSLRGVVRRPGEDNLMSTVLSYPATILTTMLLFPAHVELVGIVVAVLAFGDTAAFLGGRRFGRRPLPWNAGKTWCGTISFVIVAAPTAALSYWILAPADRAFSVALACGTVAALAGALAESLPVRLTDNLRVGIAAAVSAALVHHGIIGLTIF